MSYDLSFQLVFYSRDGIVSLTDSIDANPSFGDCAEPATSIQDALREVSNFFKVFQGSGHYSTPRLGQGGPTRPAPTRPDP